MPCLDMCIHWTCRNEIWKYRLQTSNHLLHDQYVYNTMIFFLQNIAIMYIKVYWIWCMIPWDIMPLISRQIGCFVHDICSPVSSVSGIVQYHLSSIKELQCATHMSLMMDGISRAAWRLWVWTTIKSLIQDAPHLKTEMLIVPCFSFVSRIHWSQALSS